MALNEVEADDTAGYQRLVNPAIVGPGQWYTLHSFAAFCDTNPSRYRAMFVAFVTDFLSKIRCEKCNGHANQYLAQNPIDANVRPNQPALDLFRWTWNFHNKVNERLGKPQVSWDDAVSIFVTNDYLQKQYEKAVAEGREMRACTADCDETSTAAQEQTSQVAPTASTSRTNVAPRSQPSLAGALSNLTAWASSPSLGPTNGGKSLFGAASTPRNFPPPLNANPQQSYSGSARPQPPPLFSSSSGATISGAGFIVKRSK